METSGNTSENEIASNVKSVKYETHLHAGCADANKNRTESCTRQPEFKSSRFPSEYSQRGGMEEPQCIGASVFRPERGSSFANDCFDSSTAQKSFVRNLSTNPTRRFEEVLNRWLPVRNKNIRRLRQLLVKVSDDEAIYNNVDLKIKYGSQFCKREKIGSAPSSPWEFLYSLGSFACDVTGGLSSISHVINTNNIQAEFQQIMDEDADATKEMYEARSRYITEYRYTEEVIRKFEGTTLSETVEKVSDAIGVTEFFQKMEKAQDNGEDTMTAIITALKSVMTRNCNRDVGREVGDAVQDLIDTNPAYGGVAAGAAKSVYGAADLYLKSKKDSRTSRALVSVGTRAVDIALVMQDERDIAELEHEIKDGSMTTIGKRIQEALDMFEKERNEMLELLHKL